MNGEPEYPLLRIAERVADLFFQDGYAFIEDDQTPLLAEALRLFLVRHAIAIRAPSRSG